MKYTRKTEKGEPFNSLTEIINWARQGYYLYYGNRPMHPEFVLNQTISYIERALMREWYSRAYCAGTREPYKAPLHSPQ